MFTLDSECLVIIFSFLGIQDLLAASQVSKKWSYIFFTQNQSVMSERSLHERIWKNVADSHFGGPVDNKNGSWQHACIVWEKTRRSQLSQPLQKRVAWAVSKGHGVLLSKMWENKKLDKSDIKDPKSIIASAANKGYYSILSWCALVGIEADWPSIICKMAKKGLTVEHFLRLINRIPIDHQALADEFMKAQVSNRVLLSTVLHLPGVDVKPKCFYFVLDSDNPELLEVVQNFYLEKSGQLLFLWDEVLEGRTAVGEPPLHYAVKKSLENSLKWLISVGANVNAPHNDVYPIIRAINSCSLPITKILLEAGANVNVLSLSQHTPLHVACKAAKLDFVKLLLSYGADINVRTPDEQGGPNGSHVLFTTFRFIPLLLDHGADPSVLTSQGDNIMQYYIGKRYDFETEARIISTFERLLKEGVDPNHKNVLGQNALLVNKGNIPVFLMQWLVEVGGVSLTERDNEGNTALMACLYGGTCPICEDSMLYLIEKGVDVHAINNAGQNILNLVCSAFHPMPKMIDLLLDKGVKLLHPPKGITPLHSVCYRALPLATVQNLVKHGADKWLFTGDHFGDNLPVDIVKDNKIMHKYLTDLMKPDPRWEVLNAAQKEK